MSDLFSLHSIPLCAVLVQPAPPSSRWWESSVIFEIVTVILGGGGIKAFSFASAALENFGKANNSWFDKATNGLVLVAAVASCQLVSLFPC
ncbi:hypothetical protein TSUD_98590 [Trifolium subterraneum]|uniref:Uncharacterized protein n=1 Tax=Trifolium subterraneum TaxID=3900 RepID=A0A2Z6PEW1_TRISU|nr:hypothetical protein TSUD_98590 [Trifolium subterraneum]